MFVIYLIEFCIVRALSNLNVTHVLLVFVLTYNPWDMPLMYMHHIGAWFTLKSDLHQGP